MPRTTAELVEGIIVVDEGDQLGPFILTANDLVTEICASAGYTVTRLELIERWLAAHFYACYKPRATSETVDDAHEAWQEMPGRGFKSTWWGQQAMRLDTKGGLSKLDAETERRHFRRMNAVYLGTRDTPVEDA